MEIIGFTNVEENIDGWENTRHTIQIKRFEDALDLEEVAVCTALAGFYRVYGFRAHLQAPVHVSSGMGRSRYFDPGMKSPDWMQANLDGLPSAPGSDTVIVIDKIWDVDAARKAVQTAADQITAPLVDA